MLRDGWRKGLNEGVVVNGLIDEINVTRWCIQKKKQDEASKAHEARSSD